MPHILCWTGSRGWCEGTIAQAGRCSDGWGAGNRHQLVPQFNGAQAHHLGDEFGAWIVQLQLCSKVNKTELFLNILYRSFDTCSGNCVDK